MYGMNHSTNLVHFEYYIDKFRIYIKIPLQSKYRQIVQHNFAYQTIISPKPLKQL